MVIPFDRTQLENMCDYVGLAIHWLRRGHAADAHELLEKALAIGLAAIETEDRRLLLDGTPVGPETHPTKYEGKMNITDEQIDREKQHTMYTDTAHHEHPDCIRIAVQWLAAQQWVKRPNRRALRPIKHIIESWAGRYVSEADVCVAATLLGLQGRYPYFNISSRLTRPNLSRLEGIGEAMTQKNYLGHYGEVYSGLEEES